MIEIVYALKVVVSFQQMNRTISYGSINPGDLIDSEINSIGNRTWKLDCPRMIVKRKQKKNPETYYGSGQISFSENGYLFFKLLASRERNTKEWDFQASSQPGTIVPDHDYYSLQATDVHGRRWTADRFLPSIHKTAFGKAVISCGLSDLALEGKFPPKIQVNGNSISIWIFDDINFPCNERTSIRKSTARGRQKSFSGQLNAWKFRCLETDFLIIRESAELTTVKFYSSKYEFPPFFEYRVIEAIEILLGKPLNWTVLKKASGNQFENMIHSRRNWSPSGRFPAPLPPQMLKNPKTNKFTTIYRRKFVERYLKHTSESDIKHHPLWGKSNAIFEASTARFIDAEALTLTVAIESLLATEFPKIGQPNKEDMDRIPELVGLINTLNGGERLKARISGMIGNLRQSRAMDKLRELEELGAITKAQYQAWQDLRNPSTHSFQSSKKPHQEWLDLIHQNQLLFYHLIFFAIGYRGPYTDFSIKGWPLKVYPERTNWPN